MREKKFPSFHDVFEIDLTGFDGDFVVKEKHPHVLWRGGSHCHR